MTLNNELSLAFYLDNNSGQVVTVSSVDLSCNNLVREDIKL